MMRTQRTHSYLMTRCLPPISLSWREAPWDSRPAIFFQLNPFDHSPNITSSLRRGCICRFQMLLGLTRAVILRLESRVTHDHILLSQIRDSLNLEGQVHVFISPRNRVARLYPQALSSLFIASYNSQGCGGGIPPRLHTGFPLQSQSHIATDGQSISKS
jgi:hypothetical protein